MILDGAHVDFKMPVLWTSSTYNLLACSSCVYLRLEVLERGYGRIGCWASKCTGVYTVYTTAINIR